MKTFLLSTLLFFFVSDLSAVSAKNSNKTLEKLVLKLSKGANSDLEKVERFHDWIATNITYDTKAYFSGNRRGQDFANTLASKKSLCGGYADLFQKMCESAGIPCEKVRGYSRGYGFALFDEENPDDGNHVWNAVKIDGSWYLLDVTWDSGYMNGKKFIERFSKSYFLRSPAEMIFTHFPTDPKWQLLKNPLSNYEFSKLPYLNGRFFDEGFVFSSRPKKINQISTDDPFQLLLQVPENKVVNGLVVDERGNVCRECVWVNRTGNEAEINLNFPKKGKWTVNLMQKEVEDEQFNNFGKLGFVVKKASEHEYPLAYRDFQINKCRLNAPMERTLKSGQNTQFSLNLPGYKVAAFLVDNRWVYLEHKSGDLFEGNLQIPRGIRELGLYVGKNANDQQLHSVIQWQVR